MPTPVIHGFAVSPHVRAARIALAEKGVAYELREVGLDALSTPEFRALNPFGKIPVMTVDAARVFETPAIMVYADAVGTGPALQPADPLARARCWSFVGVAQHHLYPVAVLQLYFHEVLAPAFGLPSDPAVAEAAVAPLAGHLDVLEDALADGFLAGGALSMADILCGVMADYAARTRAGRALLDARPRTAGWLGALRGRASFAATFPAALQGRDQD